MRCSFESITLYDNKAWYACRHRCETIWVCQKILALHQLASTAAQTLSGIHFTSKLSYWRGQRLDILIGDFESLVHISWLVSSIDEADVGLYAGCALTVYV